MDQDPEGHPASRDLLRVGLLVFFLALIGIAVALLVLPALHL